MAERHNLAEVDWLVHTGRLCSLSLMCSCRSDFDEPTTAVAGEQIVENEIGAGGGRGGGMVATQQHLYTVAWSSTWICERVGATPPRARY